jgi:uncharacterized protein DUF4279
LTEATKLPEISAQFSIRGLGLDLPEITSSLGLEPTTIRNAGSRSRDPLMPRVDLWILESKVQKSVDGAAAVSEIVDVLDGVLAQLDHVRAIYPQAVFDLVLVGYVVYPGCIMPDITLSHQLLARLARLGIQFAVSLYPIEAE